MFDISDEAIRFTDPFHLEAVPAKPRNTTVLVYMEIVQAALGDEFSVACWNISGGGRSIDWIPFIKPTR